MLQNAYSLAKIGADTAESERNLAENLLRSANYPGAAACSGKGAAAAAERATDKRPASCAVSKISKIWQFQRLSEVLSFQRFVEANEEQGKKRSQTSAREPKVSRLRFEIYS